MSKLPSIMKPSMAILYPKFSICARLLALRSALSVLRISWPLTRPSRTLYTSSVLLFVESFEKRHSIAAAVHLNHVSHLLFTTSSKVCNHNASISRTQALENLKIQRSYAYDISQHMQSCFLSNVPESFAHNYSVKV